MSITFNDHTAWRLVGRLSWAAEVADFKNIKGAAGSVPLKNQRLAADNEVFVYALKDQAVEGRDFYMVTGNCHHGISGQPPNPAKNWVSVGFYGVKHAFKLRCGTPGANLLESGPNSTVETATVGFSLGGSVAGELSGKGVKGTASFDAGVSFSYSASEVSIGMSPMTHEVAWHVRLPHVGWIGPGNPANPGNASYFGYAWEAGSVFSVPKGAVFEIASEFSTYLRYDYTRGHQKRDWQPAHAMAGSYDPNSGQWTEKPRPAVAPFLPFPPFSPFGAPVPLPRQKMGVVDTMRALCATAGNAGLLDSSWAALELTGIGQEIGSFDHHTVAFVPTNHAWERLFQDGSPESAGLIGPGSQKWLHDKLQASFVSLPPDTADQVREIVTSPELAGDRFRVVECLDGLLVLLEQDVNDAVVETFKERLAVLLRMETAAAA